jgi:hypothetical protein
MLNIPYPKCLGPEGFGIFHILEYLHIYAHMHNEIYWKWNHICLNMKLIYVSYALCTHCLKAILYNTFSVPMFFLNCSVL